MIRWMAKDKAAVVEAVRGGQVTLDGALGVYEISLAEFREWERLYDAHGLPGLKTTKLQKLRRADGDV